jgi:OOP family OmpA-OmpF porin
MGATDDRLAPPVNGRAGGQSDHDDDAELASLRTILLGPEQQRLSRLQARLEDPEARAQAIGEVLPQVLLRHAHDPQLTRALTPPLEQAITTSVRRNPKPLADALFPVMGPAIRKAVAASLASMVESLNRTLEHSFSRRSLQWRLEAWRTGKSFGEVVLLKTLLYRVEQVFLIDRRSGLLLQHVHAGAGGVQDADMISGMLTAIRDFVQDSFKVSEAEALESLEVGDLSVWIEPGPHAVIAAVIRGTPPRDLRRLLQDTVEAIHLEFAEPLESFAGDASTLDGCRPALEACLQTQYRTEDRRPRRGVWMVIAAAGVALLVWAGFAYRTRAREARFLEALRAEPGITVVSAERAGGRLIVSGLRDPRSRDPRSLLAPAGLSSEAVDARWSPYYALDAPLVLARARDALQPPAGTTLDLQDGVLSVRGDPPVEWIAEARRIAPLVAGISSFDAAGALDASARGLIARLEQHVLLFVKGLSRPLPDQDESLRAVADDLRRLDSLGHALQQRFRVEIVGHTDADGPPASNLPLSRARAAHVLAATDPAALRQLDVVAAGAGSDKPAVVGENEADKQRNRRVTIRVTRLPG